ncbi:secreted RxLR effector protein 161-like [Apium graveolens]|uniref:secreted RxLR effector protein 161-like n=1 Tax=Apium graveolens TaxID=4045 RepID=UPI003D79D860
MPTAKTTNTLSATNAHLSVAYAPKSAEKKEYMSRVSSASAVGSLIYAMRVFQYLKGISDVGPKYSGDTECLVTGFSDSDYAGNVDSRRSMTYYAFTLGGSIVSWKATLQPTVTLSTTEVEYMVLTKASKEEIRLKGLVSDLGLHMIRSIMSGLST